VLKLDIVPSLGLNCYFSHFNYTQEVLVVTISPIVLAVLIFIAYDVLKISDDLKLGSYLEPEALKGAFNEKEMHSIRCAFAAIDLAGQGKIKKKHIAEALKKLPECENADEEELEEEVKLSLSENDILSAWAFSNEIEKSDSLVDFQVNHMFAELYRRRQSFPSVDLGDEGDECIDFCAFMFIVHHARKNGCTSALSMFVEKVAISPSAVARGQNFFYLFLM